jgi:6-phosphofructokinase 1
VEETFTAGRKAVQFAVEGVTDHMVAYERKNGDGKYVCDYKLVNLSEVANTEKTIPMSWIKEDNTGLTQEFYDYALPLIAESPSPDGGLPATFCPTEKIACHKINPHLPHRGTKPAGTASWVTKGGLRMDGLLFCS